jgi:polysaccharide export outer membrane protein
VRFKRPFSFCCALTLVCAGVILGDADKPVTGVKPNPLYRLGPGDEIGVSQPNAEELDDKTARIDSEGWVNLPLAGRVQLGGLTAEQAEQKLTEALSKLLIAPQPVVSIVEYRSQPVSVIGAVNTPGVVQLQGSKTLLEVLSMAGGLRPDAGAEVMLTRSVEYGRLPVRGETLDAEGGFSSGHISVPALMKGKDPANNIAIFPHDVISVQRAEVIYVTGDVKKAGGFPLNSGESISILEAISLAEGFGPSPAPKKAIVFRPREDSKDKEEIHVDVSAILAGQRKDMELSPRDVLFIPDSLPKKAGYRAAEAALQAVTGIAIWGRF